MLNVVCKGPDNSHLRILRITMGILVGPKALLALRWLNTVFAHAFADAIQRAHRDYKKQTCRQKSDPFNYLTRTRTICAIFL